ncbi:hypothetical protein VQ044_24945, partial [Aurantimonas sp. C2-5-R2]
ARRDDGIALILIAESPKQVIKLVIYLGNPGLEHDIEADWRKPRTPIIADTQPGEAGPDYRYLCGTMI